MKRVQRSILLTLAGTLVISVSAAATRKTATLRGWVSDEICSALHTKPGREDCVVKCRRGGASVGHPEWLPQRLMIVAERDKKIWIVENPNALDGRVGRHVEVAGVLDAEKNTIRIQRVTELPNANHEL